MNAIQRWSKSGLPMVIKNSQLSPITKNKELETHDGTQGTAYGIVQKSTGKEWVIKKFHQGCLPPKNYLKKIRKVVPDDPAFISAKKRLILVPDDLRNKPNHYHSFQMARWLENSILMQKAPGKSWKEISDDIRDGNLADYGVRCCIAMPNCCLCGRVRFQFCVRLALWGPSTSADA